MRVRRRDSLNGNPVCGFLGDEPMKRSIRAAVLIVGIVGTYLVAAVPKVPALDGGPILLCPPKQPNCQINLPPQ